MPTETKKKAVSIDGPGVKVDHFSADNVYAKAMLENLASQPLVLTRIPREAKEPIDATASIIVNSLRINVRKGVSVKLPQQIVDIIDDSYYRTDKATQPTQINPFSGKTNEARMDLKPDEEVNKGF